MQFLTSDTAEAVSRLRSYPVLFRVASDVVAVPNSGRGGKATTYQFTAAYLDHTGKKVYGTPETVSIPEVAGKALAKFVSENADKVLATTFAYRNGAVGIV